ncbi:hypothetical protein BYI23_E001490 (plasmid) [Burkholderia sp. YI23]|nr:hypothetical protein BYI23_E001490 [Burkholderia sp. YI23]
MSTFVWTRPGFFQNGAIQMKYEVMLSGFNGATDETDDRILWISSEMSPDQLELWLRGNNLLLAGRSGVVWACGPLPASFPTEFDLPRDAAAFEQLIRERVGVETMTECEFRALMEEVKRRELLVSQGQGSAENDARLLVLRDLLGRAPWSIHVQSGRSVPAVTGLGGWVRTDTERAVQYDAEGRKLAVRFGSEICTFAELEERLHRAEKGDDVPILMSAFGCDYDGACDLVFGDQHTVALDALDRAANGCM